MIIGGKMSKKILILGNSGYVGSVLIPALSRYGGFEIHGQDAMWFGSINSSSDVPEKYLVSQRFGDIRDITIHDLSNYNAIVILSAVSNDPMGNTFDSVTNDINYNATLRVAKLAKDAGVERVVFASSCSVYGLSDDQPRKESDQLNPLTAYAKSKIQVEEGLNDLSSKDFSAICLRFATAGGISPRLRLDLVLNDFVASAVLRGFIEILSDGSPWRPIIHTEDMARAIIWAINEKKEMTGNFLSVNVGSEDWTFSIKELADIVSNVLGNIEVKIDPDGLPDPRSYKVDFSLFKKLAKNFQPIKSINSAITELDEQIKGLKIQQDFRSSNFIRLNHLRYLMEHDLMNDNLRWIH
jgi:nucleoside-diphosphate-sugar epimerase